MRHASSSCGCVTLWAAAAAAPAATATITSFAAISAARLVDTTCLVLVAATTLVCVVPTDLLLNASRPVLLTPPASLVVDTCGMLLTTACCITPWSLCEVGRAHAAPASSPFEPVVESTPAPTSVLSGLCRMPRSALPASVRAARPLSLGCCKGAKGVVGLASAGGCSVGASSVAHIGPDGGTVG